MAGFDEQIVREYFELHGFLVRQIRKFSAPSRAKVAEEEIDLLIHNPAYSEHDRAPNFLLFATELPYIHRALVSVRSWHSTPRFTPSMLRSSSELFKFLEKHVLKSTDDLIPSMDKSGEGEVLRILVLPGLPTSEPHRGECIQSLREKGVGGIISFRSMLLDVIQKVELNRNYSKSDSLQILRILKSYDLVKDPQLALFKE